MTIRPAIISDPGDVTPEWMTEVMRGAGHDVRITDLVRESVGTGQMAHNERFHFSFAAGDPGTSPATVVVKFPSPSEESRAAGAQGGYRSEVRFYTDLAEGLSISTAGCIHGAVSDDSTVFTLVLEDLAPARPGDQLHGATDEQVLLAATDLAGLHAPRWNDPTLFDLDWLDASGANAIDFIELVTPIFIDRYRHRLTDQTRSVFEAFGANVAEWIGSESDSFTLVHGDFRLDNLMFSSAEGGAPVTTVDWQTLGIGAGGRDLAYLLGNSSESADRRQHETAAIDGYVSAMGAHGIDLSHAETMAQYRHGTFQGPFITMLGSIAVGQTDRGDEMFMAMAERSAAQIVDHDALDLITG